ncbi:MAG TPA: hypothetical protein ENJ84_13080, partial [Gammaproteobacteria bacterium]|nr:hypothetical protein [Gammaproteobacteria bacterium]
MYPQSIQRDLNGMARDVEVNQYFPIPKKALATAVLLSVSTLSGTAFAEGSPSDRSFDRRIYIGINGGITRLEPRTKNTGFHVGDDSSTGGSLYLGYDITKHWSVEAFAADLGESGIDRDTNNARAGDISYQNYGASAIGYFYNSRRSSDYSHGFDDEGYFRREGLSAFGRIGLGRLENDSKLPFDQLESTDLHLGLGLEYGWANGFAARAELISYDEDVNMVALGLLKRFGEASPYPYPEKPAPAPHVTHVMPPADLAPPPPEVPKPVVPEPAIELPVVYFYFDQSTLTDRAKSKLDKVGSLLVSHPDMKLIIEGHTDSFGSEHY